MVGNATALMRLLGELKYLAGRSGKAAHDLLMMWRAFADHRHTTARAPLIQARNTCIVRDPLSALGADAGTASAEKTAALILAPPMSAASAASAAGASTSPLSPSTALIWHR